MAKKIYITDNYFFIEDTVTGELLSAPKRKVHVKKPNVSSTSYRIEGVNGQSPGQEIAFANIQDVAGAPYLDQPTFETFYRQNTGV